MSGINGNSDSYHQPVPLSRFVIPLCLLFNSSYRSYQRFDMQTRRTGQFCFVLTLLPRLRAFLNKGIFDSRHNSDNSYMYSSVMVYLMAGLIHRRKNITC